jgi:hypothetical protein
VWCCVKGKTAYAILGPSDECHQQPASINYTSEPPPRNGTLKGGRDERPSNANNVALTYPPIEGKQASAKPPVSKLSPDKHGHTGLLTEKHGQADFSAKKVFLTRPGAMLATTDVDSSIRPVFVKSKQKLHSPCPCSECLSERSWPGETGIHTAKKQGLLPMLPHDLHFLMASAYWIANMSLDFPWSPRQNHLALG